MMRWFSFLLLWLLSISIYAWNSMGHQTIAFLAYEQLKPHTKELCEQYLHYLDPFSPELNFVSAASWLDQIRAKGVHWFDPLHYVDLPFSTSPMKLPQVAKMNALWGIKQALALLSSPKASAADKGLALAIVIHLVGDIHQPLHTANKISKPFPKGDRGGNLYYLSPSAAGTNLHQYWDNGGGILLGQNALMKAKAEFLKNKKCEPYNLKKTPKEWVKESNQLALTEVYTLRSHRVPSKNYQMKVQELTKEQILKAGCRLGMLLNKTLE